MKQTIDIMKTLTASAKSPKGLAEELKRQLVKRFGLNEQYVYVWSPDEASALGYGNNWTLCAEEGPFEWVPTLTGWNEKIYDHPTVFCEAYNSYILTFSKK